MSIRKTAIGAVLFTLGLAESLSAAEPIKIGSQRELFVDGFLIEQLDGARQVLHRPTPREVVLKHDAPWEGSGTGYHSVFKDGDIYRMYYKAWQISVQKGRVVQPHPLIVPQETSSPASVGGGPMFFEPRPTTLAWLGSCACNETEHAPRRDESSP